MKEKRIARRNTAALEAGVRFDPEEYHDELLPFDFKKTNEEKIFDRLLENIPEGNDTYFIKHREGTNVFRLRKDDKQPEKDHLTQLIESTDRNLLGQKISWTFHNLKQIRNRAIEYLK